MGAACHARLLAESLASSGCSKGHYCRPPLFETIIITRITRCLMSRACRTVHCLLQRVRQQKADWLLFAGS
jgi:hypothetical protein